MVKSKMRPRLKKEAHPLDNIDATKLQKEAIRLQLSNNGIIKEFARFDAEKKELFNKALGRSAFEKQSLAHQINLLDKKAQLKKHEFERNEKQLLIVSNILIFKKYLTELRKMPIWAEIRGLTQEQLTKILVDVKFIDEDLNGIVNTLTIAMNNDLPITSHESDQAVTDILKLMDDVESGEIDKTAAESTLSLESNLERRMEESVL